MRGELNPFYTKWRPEENAVRALAVVLSNLDPRRLRTFLHDVFLSGSEIQPRYEVSDAPGVEVDLQFSVPRGDDVLTVHDGVLVGITYPGSIGSDFDLLDQSYRDTARNGVPDARIVDRANGVTVLVETQKGDWQTGDHLRRHMRFHFGEGTPAERVYVEVRWDDVIEGLRALCEGGADERERYLIGELVDYLDEHGLVTRQ